MVDPISAGSRLLDEDLAAWRTGINAKLDGLTAYKPVDETGSANSITYQDDDHLTIPVAATGVYGYGLHTTLTAGATPQMKMRFQLPSGSLRAAAFHYTNQFGLPASPTTISEVSGLTGTNVAFAMHGTLFVGATGGAFKVQWAQVVSNAAAITVHQGSRLTLVRLA